MTAKPEISAVYREKIEAALREVEKIDPSEAEVAVDNLASTLRESFFADHDKHFIRRTPSLYEVVERMHSSYGLPEPVVDAANELITSIEEHAYLIKIRGYPQPWDEQIFQRVKQWANTVVQGITKFLSD
jgi:hypothetical protein